MILKRALTARSEITIAPVERLSAAPSPHPNRKWGQEPSLREVLALWVVTSLVFVAVVAVLRNYLALVDDSGDASAYMAVASAIRHWNFHGLMVKQFWGLPYAMAALSTLTGVSDRTALLLICFSTSLASVAIAHRLWGGW